MRRFLGAAALVGLLGVPFFATETACFPQGQCDGSWDAYCTLGSTNCRGQLLDNGTTWVSGPLEATWLTFPKERVWHVDPRDANGNKLRGRITSVDYAISATETHDLIGNAGGNNAQWKYYPGDQTLDVQNDTCQDYYVYMVVHSTLDADAGIVPAVDAGTDAAADAAAAAVDAAADAASE